MKILLNNLKIEVVKYDNEDYISLTDMSKFKDYIRRRKS